MSERGEEMAPNRSRTSRKGRDGGQIIVLFALGLVAFIAGVGLVDAGNAYAQQRGVQNGADAAANAGTVIPVLPRP